MIQFTNMRNFVMICDTKSQYNTLMNIDHFDI